MRIEVQMLTKYVKITKIANYFIFNYLQNVLFIYLRLVHLIKGSSLAVLPVTKKPKHFTHFKFKFGLNGIFKQ